MSVSPFRLANYAVDLGPWSVHIRSRRNPAVKKRCEHTEDSVHQDPASCAATVHPERVPSIRASYIEGPGRVEFARRREQESRDATRRDLQRQP